MTTLATTELNFGGRVAILGSGREGLAAYDYLKGREGIESLDIISEGLSGRGREEALIASGTLQIRRFADAGLDEYDALVRSPGVSPYRECIRAARRTGTRIVNPSSIWFGAHPDANTIVVTGTKGKSTTSALLAHLLEHAGKKVRLAGNFGTPLLACDDEAVDWWVIEMSSFQLADLEARPRIGVILNLSADHLDWHGSVERYRADKLRLAELVDGKALIVNGADTVLRDALGNREGITWFSDAAANGPWGDAAEIVLPDSLPGKHNRANLAACLAVAARLGLEADQFLGGLATFHGLPHRLQNLGKLGGVRCIDDSISTAPVATLAALESLSGQTVVLLVGGLDRGIDWAPFAQAMRAHPPAAVIGLPDNGGRIIETLENAGLKPELGMMACDSLERAVSEARRLAPERAVILLSPGAPSFPHFRDYEDRGDQFQAICGRQ